MVMRGYYGYRSSSPIPSKAVFVVNSDPVLFVADFLEDLLEFVAPARKLIPESLSWIGKDNNEIENRTN